MWTEPGVGFGEGGRGVPIEAHASGRDPEWADSLSSPSGVGSRERKREFCWLKMHRAEDLTILARRAGIADAF